MLDIDESVFEIPNTKKLRKIFKTQKNSSGHRELARARVSGINDWDLNENARYTNMFQNAPTHPEFTKVDGTWDSNGTFTPTV